MISAKKLKKEKIIGPILENEFPFKLPATWHWCYISDLCYHFTGNSINKNLKVTKYSQNNNGLNYIGTKDVGFEMLGINYDTNVIIPQDELNEKFRVAPKGSTIICIEGGSSGKKKALVGLDICFGNKLLASVPFSNLLSEYIYYYFNSFCFSKEFKEKSKGLRGGVSKGAFKTIKIPLPPKEEVGIVVSEIKSLLSDIYLLENEIVESEKKSKIIMQSILQEAFVSK